MRPCREANHVAQFMKLDIRHAELATSQGGQANLPRMQRHSEEQTGSLLERHQNQ